MDLNDPNVRIQYRIQQATAQGEFNEALYFTADEFQRLLTVDLQASIDNRVNNWLTFVSEQSEKVAPEPTAEEIAARRKELEDELGRLG